MTRADYKVIAAVLHRTRRYMDAATFRALVAEFAEELRLHNVRFNRAKFENACNKE